MKLLYRWILLVTVTLAAATLPAQTASHGTVAGRVTDTATKLTLSGVRVAVRGTAVETYTTDSGDYVLREVPAGLQTIEFGYVGYGDVVLTVQVPAGATARLDAAFGGDAVHLDKFVIEGSLVGTARAINQQRAASTLTNIVAADEIGRFPDQNAAESLQRVPGVSLYRDQGEGRYIVLRGLNYTFTSVKVNGASFAGADLGERATALDVIPTDALASIEVTKVPTPDMDGEGLGGQVDIKTKSPFDADGVAASVTAQGQYSALKDKFSEKFNGYVSTRFGDAGQFGLLVAPTWQTRKFGSYNHETGGSYSLEEAPDTGDEFYLVEEFNYRDYDIERERYGVNVALEAKPDDATHLYLHAGYNRFTDTEDRHLTAFDFGDVDIEALSATGATLTSEEDDGEYARLFGRELRLREKDQEVFTLLAGGTKHVGAWSLDAHAGYTEGREKRPDEITAIYEPTDEEPSTFRYTTNGAYGIAFEQLAGPDVFDAGSYEFDSLEVANESGKETEWDLAFNARRDLATAFPSYLKTGVRYRAKEKTSEAELFEYEDGPGAIQSLTDANSGAGEYPFFPVPRISPGAIRNAFYTQRDSFESERNFEDSEFDDWTINEDVLAAYLMSGATFGKLGVIAGVRWERTEFDTTGRDLEFDDEGEPVGATGVRASRSYDHWLPGVHFRYDATRRFVFRASYSQSLARPAFGELALRRNVNREDEEVTVGNPALEALESRNWDASVEYYLPSLGVISAAVFHKEIENFSYETEVGADPAYPDYEITSFRNGSDGSITGLELAYQQQLRFLPAPLDGLGLLANVTFLDSEATYPTRPDEDVPFIGQSDTVGNVGLTYERGPFFARLALNFRSERLREDEPLGGAFAEDLYVDDFKQLDLTLRYELTKQFEVFAEFLNLTDEPFRVFQKSDNGQGDRLGQWEEYDWSANFGVRWKL